MKTPLPSICFTYLITVGRERLSARARCEFENFSLFNRIISLIIIAPIVLFAISFFRKKNMTGKPSKSNCKLWAGIGRKLYPGIRCKLCPEWGVNFGPEYADSWDSPTNHHLFSTDY